MSAGYLIGRKSSEVFLNNDRLSRNLGAGSRIQELIDYVEREYVDSVSADSITGLAIEAVLSGLDPHSQYLPAREFDFSKESIEGKFQGIGVEFRIFDDTLFVTSVVSGGPSEKAGLVKGDAIISVNGGSLTGKKLSNDFVLKSLRGQSGTKVKLGLINYYKKDRYRVVELTRGEIPYASVHHAMLDGFTGYLNIRHFSANTAIEVSQALGALKRKKMKNLIVDLRGNPGGLLQTAVQVCDEFIAGERLITYTKGRAREQEEFRAGKTGLYERGSLAVFIDENSASAAEIFAGAVQDHDRGIIIGRRSFGKGFVQEQSQFSDGSGMRLTIARYYTPSGRCIQKSFKPGHTEEYHEEAWQRIRSGELFHQDSIDTRGLPVFRTVSGKKVFGGGGIFPDVFVPLDTSFMLQGFEQMEGYAKMDHLAFRIAQRMVSNNFSSNLPAEKMLDWLRTMKDETLWQQLRPQVNDLKNNQNLSQETAFNREYLKHFRSAIGRYIAQEDGYYQLTLYDDEFYKKAVEYFSRCAQ